jgi:hypothetical protein
MTDGDFYDRWHRGVQHYSTPGWVTDGLLANETFTGTTLERAAGEGAIARLRPQSVVASDLWDYGFGEVRDFFSIREHFDNVIPKPTFGSQQRFNAWPGGRPTTAKSYRTKLRLVAGRLYLPRSYAPARRFCPVALSLSISFVGTTIGGALRYCIQPDQPGHRAVPPGTLVG